MKTRIKDFDGRFSFEYTEVRRYPTPRDWHTVGGDTTPASWATPELRDRARACFTYRRSVGPAIADLHRARLA
jgi:hypothetical protein